MPPPYLIPLHSIPFHSTPSSIPNISIHPSIHPSIHCVQIKPANQPSKSSKPYINSPPHRIHNIPILQNQPSKQPLLLPHACISPRASAKRTSLYRSLQATQRNASTQQRINPYMNEILSSHTSIHHISRSNQIPAHPPPDRIKSLNLALPYSPS